MIRNVAKKKSLLDLLAKARIFFSVSLRILTFQFKKIIKTIFYKKKHCKNRTRDPDMPGPASPAANIFSCMAPVSHQETDPDTPPATSTRAPAGARVCWVTPIWPVGPVGTQRVTEAQPLLLSFLPPALPPFSGPFSGLQGCSFYQWGVLL